MDEINLVKRTDQQWEDLRENVVIYELLVPVIALVKSLKGKTHRWVKKERDPDNTRYYGRQKERVLLMQVSGCWENPKGTIKVIMAGEGYSAVFSRDGRVAGYAGLTVERYGGVGQDSYQGIKMGTWIACPENDNENSSEYETAFVMNGTEAEAVKVLEALYEMDATREKFSYFKWENEQFRTKSNGTVYFEDVMAQKVIFDHSLRKFKWDLRKRRWDLMNALKARLTMKTENDRFKVTLNSLDKNTYGFECDPKEKVTEIQIGYHETSVYGVDYWLNFVYYDKDDSFFSKPAEDQTRSLLGLLINARNKVTTGDILIRMNSNSVVLSRKETGSGATLNYVNGQIMKDDDIYEKIVAYFLEGKTLFIQRKTATGTVSRPAISEEAQKIIDEGLNGEMEDLEGKLPFHLNLELKDRKWFVESNGKLYYIKGGMTALSKIQSAIRGTAVIDHDKYSWREGGRSGTRVIKDRLAELVGEKDALEIVLNIKRMGAMMKIMGGK